MKKIVLLALAASTVAVATPAFAQVTGTVNITGSVADKCQVTPVLAGNYLTTRNLSELSQADGTLELSATLATRFGVAGTTAPAFRVVCTTAAPKVTVEASPLLHTTPGLQALASGYTGTVNYTADVKVTTTAALPETVSDTTASGTTVLTLSNRLAASNNNVEITTSAFNTAASALLNAGGYSGQIVVTVSPN